MRYHGSFIGYDKSKRGWLKEHTEIWDKNIHTISKTMGKCPQESYTAVLHDPIVLDISTTRHKEYGICVCGSGEYASGKLFDLPLIWKVKFSLNRFRNYKYDAGQ